MESLPDRLKRIRRSLAPEEWRDSRIFVHNDVEFEHFTLVATKVSSGEVHYYNPDTEEFMPLNLSGTRSPV